MSDTNTVLIEGRLAAAPEIRTYESGGRMLRLLVTVRDEGRTDVLPVTYWLPDGDDGSRYREWQPGDPVFCSGSIRRQFWTRPEGRRSRLEIVAMKVAS